MHVVLISCVAKKKDSKSSAKDLYISPLFRSAYQYAKKIKADKIFILSAKYGLLEVDDIVEPYDETLNTKKAREVQCWADGVIVALSQKTNLNEDEFTILAGERYRKHLIKHLRKYSIPLEGLSIGKQLSFYKENR